MVQNESEQVRSTLNGEIMIKIEDIKTTLRNLGYILKDHNGKLWLKLNGICLGQVTPKQFAKLPLKDDSPTAGPYACPGRYWAWASNAERVDEREEMISVLSGNEQEKTHV